MGVVGNKFDLFSIEEVTEDEGNKFSQDIGAFFYLTSAKESIGINDLFKEIGEKYLYFKENKKFEEENIGKSTKITKENSISAKKKKGCC